jgi:hypothetical protein
MWWLPRIPLAVAVTAKAVLIPGEAGSACTEWAGWRALFPAAGRARRRAAAAAAAAPLHAAEASAQA